MNVENDSTGELVEMVEPRSIDICCVHIETRFRGMLVRVISTKALEYKFFYIGNKHS